MPRSIPEGRFDALLDAAEQCFLARGYQQAQMDDVAKVLGVAKGTLYGYVESKEALFDFVIEHSGAGERVPVPAVLPRPTPRPGAMLERLGERLVAETRMPALDRALAAPPATREAAQRTLAEVLGEVFAMLDRFRTPIKLLERCSADFPELAAAWRQLGRRSLNARLEVWIVELDAAGWIDAGADPTWTSRFLLESIATWAVHVHWDVAPDEVDHLASPALLVERLVRSLAPAVRE